MSSLVFSDELKIVPVRHMIPITTVSTGNGSILLRPDTKTEYLFVFTVSNPSENQKGLGVTVFQKTNFYVCGECISWADEEIQNPKAYVKQDEHMWVMYRKGNHVCEAPLKRVKSYIYSVSFEDENIIFEGDNFSPWEKGNEISTSIYPTHQITDGSVSTEKPSCLDMFVQYYGEVKTSKHATVRDALTFKLGTPSVIWNNTEKLAVGTVSFPWKAYLDKLGRPKNVIPKPLQEVLRFYGKMKCVQHTESIIFWFFYTFTNIGAFRTISNPFVPFQFSCATIDMHPLGLTLTNKSVVISYGSDNNVYCASVDKSTVSSLLQPCNTWTPETWAWTFFIPSDVDPDIRKQAEEAILPDRFRSGFHYAQ